MDTLLSARLSSSGSSSCSYSSGDDEPLNISLKQHDRMLPLPPPPLPDLPPPDTDTMPPPPDSDITPPPPDTDITPPPPDTEVVLSLPDTDIMPPLPCTGSPPPSTIKQKSTRLRQTVTKMQQSPKALATSTLQPSPIKPIIATASCVQGEDEMEDLDAHSDESDVFEEDIEAILFAEEEEDRRKGYTDCLMETHLDNTNYPYPAYLAKLSTLFTNKNAFGTNPEDFIYCNNLAVNPYQLKLLDARVDATEQEKLEKVRQAAEVAAKEDRHRRRHQRRMEALEPPIKKINISEASLKALEAKPSQFVSRLKASSNSSRRRVRKKSASSSARRMPVASALSHLPSASTDNIKSTSVASRKRNGAPASGKKTLGSSSRIKKVMTATVKVKAAATTVKGSKSVEGEQAKPRPVAATSNSKKRRIHIENEKTCTKGDGDPGHESSSSSFSSSSLSSSSSSTSASSSSASGNDT